jgi:hypothetical protein
MSYNTDYWQSCWQPSVYLLDAFTLNILPTWQTGSCTVRVRDINPAEAKEIIQKRGFISAIENQVTADALSLLLGVQVQVRRFQVNLNPGDSAIVFSLNKRLKEGQVIKSVNDICLIGYSLYHVSVSQ